MVKLTLAYRPEIGEESNGASRLLNENLAWGKAVSSCEMLTGTYHAEING